MKSKYEFVESKKQKAVAFPALGIMTIGSGEKKNNGKGAEGKYVILYGKESTGSLPFFQFIDIYD